MRTQKNKSHYDKDFYLWSATQASLLKKYDFSHVDLDNIIEEIESLGKSDKRSLYSHTVRLLQHMLKLEYTSENQGNSNSWKSSIRTARSQIKNLLKDSPSLNNYLQENFNEAYLEAVDLAAIESSVEKSFFPKECPWNLKEVLE